MCVCMSVCVCVHNLISISIVRYALEYPYTLHEVRDLTSPEVIREGSVVVLKIETRAVGLVPTFDALRTFL